MVYRIYVEKKTKYANEAKALLKEINEFLGIEEVTSLRILNRYDVEGIDEAVFNDCKKTIFSEPQLDEIYSELPDGKYVLAVSYLPGQFDQRADSCAQCIQIVTKGQKPTVKSAKIYILDGELSETDLNAIKDFVINPVESCEVTLDKYTTLTEEYPIPDDVAIIDGFIDLDESGLRDFLKSYGLAMDYDDLLFCQEYFKEEKRNPTLTEIKMIDTYWSDHCRHTTFMTQIDDISFGDARTRAAFDKYLAVRKELGRENKPVTLMDMATIGARYLKAKGKLTNLDESEEINACTIKINVDIDGKDVPYLLLYKNETHNHPTEIEPFGGAATCIGGAIRDPLSGRGYVYQAMRITGAGNPLKPLRETIKGKLPQKKIVTTAAAGYSSYGNQIGLATGLVDEIYHDGYIAKHMEVGAVIASAPAENVKRERPEDGDVVMLIGGRTGRDGCGGATGSSKSHNVDSLTLCGAEVQKGNAPEERKIQRLFRNPNAAKLIKRCNDFGAGGVSVAIGELADGLQIDLNKVPKKYDGLDGTELAISESQERMAVVLAPEDVEAFSAFAAEENLEATIVATVTAEPRLKMTWRDKDIVNIGRDFLNSAGAPKKIVAETPAPTFDDNIIHESIADAFKRIAADLNICSKRGLSERFDSTIGAGTVLMPFGGKYQRTPIQTMVAKIPVDYGETNTCSLMSYGYQPEIMEKDLYLGGYLSVVESVAKIIATGGELKNITLSMQEYFESLGNEPSRWGKPAAALLGAITAQLDLEVGAIGGKDSMSGSFEDIHVPPTLISFAVAYGKEENIISPEFKTPNKRIALILPKKGQTGLFDAADIKNTYNNVTAKIKNGKIEGAMAVSAGGIGAALLKMSLGNRIGFHINEDITTYALFYGNIGGIVIVTDDEELGITIGHTTADYTITYDDVTVDIDELEAIYENTLEPIFPSNAEVETHEVKNFDYSTKTRVSPGIKVAKPRILIPVFPGTNCEYDTAAAFKKAGGESEIVVIRNLSGDAISESVTYFAKAIKNSQIIFIPGGFSGGDEPDGSGKFITSFFRNPEVTEAVNELLARDGLIGGICNGFQALIKLGLVPYGEIRTATEDSPTLTFNNIARHQSRLVRTRVASNKSPWLMHCNVGDTHLIPISHGEGKFICPTTLLVELGKNGQIATQYADIDGKPSMAITANPNGSISAVEGITSPDGRVFGRMAHAERTNKGLYKNVPGDIECPMFLGAIDYFK